MLNMLMYAESDLPAFLEQRVQWIITLEKREIICWDLFVSRVLINNGK